MWGKREYNIPIATLSPPECDSCIKMGSDENHFSVSLIVRNKVTRQFPQTTTLLEEKGELKRYRSEALLLTCLAPYR